MKDRDDNGVKESPPFKPKPVPKLSDADMKRYKEILAKRNKERKPMGEKDKDKDKNKNKGVQGGARGWRHHEPEKDFFDNLVEVSDGSAGIAAPGVVVEDDGADDAKGAKSANGANGASAAAEPYCFVTDSRLMHGVHPS
eukprot:581368-Prymnesium_polylepis.4